jgi:diguanylate cyclase (GGDEF)-like protein
MPGFDALAALRVLKESGKDIPFVIYSGRITDGQAVSAMHDGVHDYIAKGNYARLLPVIQRELRNADTRRAMREADGRMQELANFDALTGLPNGNLFCTRLAEWAGDGELRGATLQGCVLCLDIDRFTRVNASFGHDAGDAILRQVGERLAVAVPSGAVVARGSGDAFAIFVPDVVSDEAVAAVVAQVRQIFDAPFTSDQIELFMGASIGVSRFPGDAREPDELLMHAETAMALSGRRGGDGVEYFHQEMNETHADRVALETDLRHAVERGELHLHYQPCVAASTGRTVGMEALLRWQHPQRGLTLPGWFIPAADESGAIVEIGAWVLLEACRQGRIWQDLGHDVYVSLNVSAVQFAQPRLLENVGKALRESGFAAGRLQLEITESVLMHDADSAVRMLRTLKNMGVRLAIDDFGTGYSSLAYLKRFPLDILKIDRSFVRDVPQDQDGGAIVRAIVSLAHNLRMATVAEGVESRDQAEFLQREGCDFCQGLYFGRPAGADAMQMRLAREQAIAAAFPAGIGQLAAPLEATLTSIKTEG